ncbi:hypothetical protein [Corynebacterium sp.]|uniref:hypothetical protein n=1 Tax=Corynebacterium sp. TaxID=1720 RepID=UPI0026E07E50|nr:hypothetical protein [Corynebacterium sp.]MDO5512641.1 hypothetical protein [Corynebacterium sp.]
MSLYRLQPRTDRRWWFALFGATALTLLLPALLLPVVPSRTISEQVVLGSEEGWNIPLEMQCRPSTEVLHAGWSCGDVLTQTMNVAGGTDPDRTLRRMMRAMAMFPPPEDAEILREGSARMIIDDFSRSVGMSLEGGDDREDETMIVVLTGPGGQVAPLADTVWQEFTGRELPGIVREAIEATRGDGGFRLPLEPQVVTV